MTISTILALFFITLFALVSWAYISEKRRKALSMALQQETFYIANHDFLTTLHNRYSLNKDLPKVLENTHNNHELWVMMIDIDHFKTVNDTFGHDIGDNALQALGRILKSSCQNIEGAKAYRLGGEEFLLVIANYDPILIERLFHKIQLSLNHADIEGLNKVIHISAGATAYQNNETQYDLLKRADKAMYQAKQQGRARIIIN